MRNAILSEGTNVLGVVPDQHVNMLLTSKKSVGQLMLG